MTCFRRSSLFAAIAFVLAPEMVRAQDQPNDAVVPATRGEGWMRRHESFNERALMGENN